MKLLTYNPWVGWSGRMGYYNRGVWNLQWSGQFWLWPKSYFWICLQRTNANPDTMELEWGSREAQNQSEVGTVWTCQTRMLSPALSCKACLDMEMRALFSCFQASQRPSWWLEVHPSLWEESRGRTRSERWAFTPCHFLTKLGYSPHNLHSAQSLRLKRHRRLPPKPQSSILSIWGLRLRIYAAAFWPVQHYLR